ncbi:hypothetical protein LTR04_001328 [Oleoguttula sp. CCFEE 6159]|nr:hypothetical protein LTR04_001328 [Oleoguttula sp. CCFEE 6159]
MDCSLDSLNGSYRTASNNNKGPDPTPQSDYLHERLEERRAQSLRSFKLRKSDVLPNRGRDDDIFLPDDEESTRRRNRVYESSPVAPSQRDGQEPRHGRRVSDAGTRRLKSMGAREMDEYVNRLSKENFDLKAELFLRRERMSRMDEQLQMMGETLAGLNRLREEKKELEEENGQLLKEMKQRNEEIERRDRAVDEAVARIVELENQMARIQEATAYTRPSTAQADTGYCGSETQDPVPPLSPPNIPDLHKVRSSTDRAPGLPTSCSTRSNNNLTAPSHNNETSARMPAFLSDKKSSMSALRSLYLDADKQLKSVTSFTSLVSRPDSKLDDGSVPDVDVLNSPRLSVLSESSFMSMYSRRVGDFDVDHENGTVQEVDEREEGLTAVDGQRDSAKQKSSARVNQWVEERVTASTPSKSNHLSRPLETSPQRHGKSHSNQVQPQFMSLNDAVQQSRPHLAPAMESPAAQGSPREDISAYITQTSADKKKPRTPILGSSVFSDSFFPPTPDSVSTRMLRTSRSSILDSKSLLDITPASARGYESLIPNASVPLYVSSNDRVQKKSDPDHSRPRSNPYHITRRIGSLEDGIDSDTEDDDQSTAIHAGFGADYAGFPTGTSIAEGTPSRFQYGALRHISPPAADMMFKGEGIDEVPSTRKLGHVQSLYLPPNSPQPNSSAARKPSLSRAETSPTFTQLSRSTTSADDPTLRPYACRSRQQSPNPSEPCTAVSGSPSSGNLNPHVPHLASASPSSRKPSLSQRTQQLFRRMSGSGRTVDSPPPTKPAATASSISSASSTTSEHARVFTPSSDHSLSSQQQQRHPRHHQQQIRPSMQPRADTWQTIDSVVSCPMDDGIYTQRNAPNTGSARAVSSTGATGPRGRKNSTAISGANGPPTGTIALATTASRAPNPFSRTSSLRARTRGGSASAGLNSTGSGKRASIGSDRERSGSAAATAAGAAWQGQRQGQTQGQGQRRAWR